MEVFRGTGLQVQLVFADTNGVPINLTGWTFFFTAKRRELDPDDAAVISVTVPASDPTDGIAMITVPYTTTDNILGPYFYDFKYVNAAGVPQVITSGVITFKTNITQRVS